jgi:hypothetical protein
MNVVISQLNVVINVITRRKGIKNKAIIRTRINLVHIREICIVLFENSAYTYDCFTVTYCDTML